MVTQPLHGCNTENDRAKSTTIHIATYLENLTDLVARNMDIAAFLIFSLSIEEAF